MPHNVTSIIYLVHYRYFCCYTIGCYIIGKFRIYIIGAYSITLPGDYQLVVTLSVNLELHYQLTLHYWALLHYRA